MRVLVTRLRGRAEGGLGEEGCWGRRGAGVVWGRTCVLTRARRASTDADAGALLARVFDGKLFVLIEHEERVRVGGRVGAVVAAFVLVFGTWERGDETT